jgi:hypothetical protein
VPRGTGSAAWRHWARVRLHAPLEEAGERIAPAAGRPTDDGEGGCVPGSEGDSLHGPAAFPGVLDLPFTVLGPPEPRDPLRTLADRHRAAAGDPRTP